MSKFWAAVIIALIILVAYLFITTPKTIHTTGKIVEINSYQQSDIFTNHTYDRLIISISGENASISVGCSGYYRVGETVGVYKIPDGGWHLESDCS